MRPFLALAFIVIGSVMLACGVAADPRPSSQALLLLCGGATALALGLQFIRHSQV